MGLQVYCLSLQHSDQPLQAKCHRHRLFTPALEIPPNEEKKNKKKYKNETRVPPQLPTVPAKGHEQVTIKIEARAPTKENSPRIVELSTVIRIGGRGLSKSTHV